MAARQPTRRGSLWPSLIFGALAIAFAAAAVVLFVREREAPTIPTPPPAPPGGNEYVHVVQALEQQGLTVDTKSPRGFIDRGPLSVPGQGVAVDGAPLYIFIFEGAGTPEAAIARVDPSTLRPRSGPTGTPVADGTPYLTSHSNVAVALFGGSDEVRQKVDRAIQGLP